MDDMIREHAPAKLNLFLHVIGRRPDGYHELESLVVFTEFGDELEIDASQPQLSLSVRGPALGEWTLPWETRDNSVMRAAELLLKLSAQKRKGARIHLIKNIPIAAGLGGGTSDAAATLRALNEVWRIGLPQDKLERLGLELGADVPVCLRRRPTLVSGIGERLSDAQLPTPLHLVIAHTKHMLPTMDVFQESRPSDWHGAAPAPPGVLRDAHSLAEFLAGTRNDLEAPAVRLQPQISTLLSDLRATKGCLLARMSGSGAACYGIFETDAAASAAAMALEGRGWWAVATRLKDQ
jgi:4-diphosphocytidyl-2-C-methyl-D-erythritol kinase